MEAAITTKSDLKEEVKENKETIKRLTKEQTILSEKEVAKQMITVISTALALVSALFWQTAINDTIKTFMPVSGAWSYELAIAFVITMIAAMIIVTIHQRQ